MKAIHEAGDAASILNNPLLVNVLADMRDNCYRRIEQSNACQMDQREEEYRMLRAIKAFEQDLKHRISNGKKAAQQQQQQQIQNELASLNDL